MADFLFSFHAGPAARIWRGTKQYEFRRVRVAIRPGDRIYVYETRPTGQLTGVLEVVAVHQGPPEELLALEPDAVSREGARAYIAGARCATALAVRVREHWGRPRPLATLGVARAPQSYQRLPERLRPAAK